MLVFAQEETGYIDVNALAFKRFVFLEPYEHSEN